ALLRLVHHRVGVIHAHTVGPGVLTHNGHYGVVGILAGPVALPFEHNLLPSYWNNPCLDHALHGVVMPVFRGAAGSVSHHVDLVSTVKHRAQRKAVVADLSPET